MELASTFIFELEWQFRNLMDILNKTQMTASEYGSFRNQTLLDKSRFLEDKNPFGRFVRANLNKASWRKGRDFFFFCFYGKAAVW